MGTVLEITLVGADPAALRAAMDPLFAEAVRLEALLSSFAAASDLHSLNAAAGRGPTPVAPELADLLARSVALSELTRGAFDVTVGPLVSLWSEAGARGALPSHDALAAARARVGAARLRILGDGRVELPAGAVVNLSGVAKGYALDRMLPLWREAGAPPALLSFGQSSVWALGAPPGAAGWRLLARAPDGESLGVLTLRDRALSVSASFGSSTRIGGRRLGHVLDPRSGDPLAEDSLALVVAPDATLAEALSKAVLVLGPREGLELVDAQPGCEALRVGADREAVRTSGFDAAVAWQALAPVSGEARSRPRAALPIPGP
jgi:thiamine biosynthesis lipoprotein